MEKDHHDPQPLAPEVMIVLTTTASEEEATTIGRALVREGLAACANILPLKKSIFQWEGQISEEQEFLMILKSRSDLFAALSEAIKALHSYKVPEIVALPVLSGSADYINWVMESTRK